MLTPRQLHLVYDDWRPGQRLAIRQALAAKTPHVLIQAPTGAGKTAIALAIQQLDRGRWVTLTASKGLMTQYGLEAPWLTDVRGMSNYVCQAAEPDGEHEALFPRRRASVMCDEGPCRSGLACGLRESGCTYYDQYHAAVQSRTPLTNYDYWLASRRWGQGLGRVDGLICDEAHDSPDKLLSACRLELPAREMPRRRPRTLALWRAWAHSRRLELQGQDTGDHPDQRMKRQRLIDVLERMDTLDASWQWDPTEAGGVTFEPTRPKLLAPLLFKGVRKVVYLSATATPATLDVLGIGHADRTIVTLKSHFPVARRPVYAIATCRVDHRWSDADQRFWLQQMDDFIEARRDRKGLLHTVSYGRQQWLLRQSRHRGMMLAPRDARSLEAAVRRFKASREPLILVSPSLTTGFDFPYAQCEYNILCKVPFPDTRSRIMQARVKATPGYRLVVAATQIQQAAGRGMRAADDSCEIAIFDDHFRWLYYYHPELFQQWFLDAIVPMRRLPTPRPRLIRAA